VKRYWRFVVPAALLVAVIGFLLLNLGNSLVFFTTPTELTSEEVDDARLRLGGQVVEGTVVDTGSGINFEVTDGITAVRVTHTGDPLDLFAEGIGVILEGTWDGTHFVSDSMLIRHDEQYRTEDGSDYDPDQPESFDP
jgi:cytochrome c-type biogenesis protein CcmE